DADPAERTGSDDAADRSVPRARAREVARREVSNRSRAREGVYTGRSRRNVRGAATARSRTGATDTLARAGKRRDETTSRSRAPSVTCVSARVRARHGDFLVEKPDRAGYICAMDQRDRIDVLDPADTTRLAVLRGDT